jgi:hypothetical protein
VPEAAALERYQFTSIYEILAHKSMDSHTMKTFELENMWSGQDGGARRVRGATTKHAPTRAMPNFTYILYTVVALKPTADLQVGICRP